MATRLSRILAITLGAALIVVSPGPAGYHAFAQVRNAPVGATWTPTGASSGAVDPQATRSASPSATLAAQPGIAGVVTIPRSILPVVSGAKAQGFAHSESASMAGPRTSSGASAVAETLRRLALAPAAIALKDSPGPSAPGASVASKTAATGSSGRAAATPGAPEEKDVRALGRTLSLGRQLEAFRRLGGSPAAEEEPVGGEDAAAKKGGELKPNEAPGASEGPAAPVPSAPEAGQTKLPRSLWGLFWGHHVLTVFGINFHMLSQPYLVTQTLSKSKALMGLVRNVHMGSMSFVNVLPLGWLIDKVNFNVLFVGTSVFRALLMGAIPFLFLSGHLTFGVLLSIVAINPLFQSTMIVADSAARKAFLGTDRRLNKEAAAILGKYDSIAGMVMPILAGLAIGGLVHAFGLGGYAVAYGVYAVMVLASIPVYLTMVKDPRDPKTLAVNTLGEAARLLVRLAGSGLRWVFWRGPRAAVRWVLGGGWRFPFKALKAVFWDWPRAIVDAIRNRGSRVPAALKDSPGPSAPGAAVEKLGWKESLARKLDRYAATKGFAYILRNHTLSTLMMVGAIEAFLGDAMPMVVLPNFILDAVGESTGAVPELGYALGAVAAVFAARLAWSGLQRLRGKKTADRAQVVGWAVLGATIALLAWKLPLMLAAAGGIFSVMLAAEYFGKLIASSRLEGAKGDKLIEKKGHGHFYRVAAMSSLLFWLLWLVPAVIAPGHFWINLGVVLLVQFGLALAHAPVGIVMAPVVREQIPDDILGRVDSAFNMIDLIFMASGALIAGIVVDQVAITTAMFIIACLITGTAALEWMVPRWIFPDGNHPAPVKPKTPDQDPPRSAWLIPPAAFAFA